MDRATAEAELKDQVAWDRTPILSQGQIDAILDLSKRPDQFSRVPSDSAWEETYDLIWAVWQGWIKKTAAATSAYNITDSGQSLSRDQIYQHCKAERDAARRRVRPFTVEVQHGRHHRHVAS